MNTKYTLEDLNILLKFLSKIPENHILDITNKRYQDPSLWSTTFSRWYYGESRNRTIEFIENIIEQANKFITSTNKPESNTILANLKNAKIGIARLVKCYNDNSIIGCKLEALSDRIEEIITKSSTINIKNTSSDFINNS